MVNVDVDVDVDEFVEGCSPSELIDLRAALSKLNSPAGASSTYLSHAIYLTALNAERLRGAILTGDGEKAIRILRDNLPHEVFAVSPVTTDLMARSLVEAA